MADSQKQAPKADSAREAKLASDEEFRKAEGEKALAEQYKRQSEAREASGVDEATQAVRAAHAAEGGGPWPAELLERNIGPVAPLVGYAPEQAYTSHEDQKD